MCPMVLPTAAFAAGAGVASGVSSSPAELTQPEGTESAIAEVNGKSYPSLQEAINAAPKKRNGEAARRHEGKRHDFHV